MANLSLIPDQHQDGLSLLPLLKQEGTVNREALYWHFPNYIGAGHPNPSRPLGVISHHDWKLIESFEDGHLELYNLKNDAQEQKNLAAKNPEMAEKLKQMLATWRQNVQVQMPEQNPEFQQP